MAATVLCSSRGGTRAGRTKELFLILTLLSLLYPASSRIEMTKLKEIKENIVKLQQDAVMRRVDNMVDRIYIPKLLEGVLQLMDNLTDLLNVPQFRSMSNLMQELKKYLKECSDYLQKYLKKEAARTQEYEEKVKQLERVIEKLAEQGADM